MAEINAESASFVLNGVSITDFIAGDWIEVNPVNPLTSHTDGAGGAVNINKRVDGDVHEVVFRVLRYSGSDVWLNDQMNSGDIVVLNGTLKEAYTQDGDDMVENWILERGSFTTRPSIVKNNQDGNDAVEYTVRFRTATRLL
jgi:hypothetical protein